MSIDRQIIFIVVFLSILALTNYYIYQRFLCQLSPRFHRIGQRLMIIIMAGEIIFVANSIANIIPASPIVYIVLSTLIGITFMMFVVSLIYDITVSCSRRVPCNHQLRRTIKLIFDTTILVAAACYLCLGFAQGLKQPEINDVIVRIKDFPINGFTIVQLSDLHIGHTVRADFLKKVVARTNAIQPNMVVITGDLFDLSAENLEKELLPLVDLDAPTFFVTGNHEYYHGVEATLKLVQSLGIKPLTNQAIRFDNDDVSFNLIGLNDLTGERFATRKPDVEGAYRNVDQAKPTIVLSHQPKSISLVDGKRCDLMLSGHTHGGQIFPFGLLVKLDQPYLSGLYQHTQGQQIFVSRGTGYWGPPLRVHAPSEISRIVITGDLKHK